MVNPPLGQYRVFETSNIDEACEKVGQIFCPHRLELVRRNARLRALQNAARLDQVSISYLAYGEEVRIIPGELETFFLIQIPLSGSSRIECGKQEILSTPGLASVPTPTEPLAMHWKADCPQLIVRFERQVLEAQLCDMLGRSLPEQIRFRLGMDMTTGPGLSWLNTVRWLVAELERDDGLARQPLVAAQVEHLLMTGLLLAQPSNYSAALHAQQRPAVPRTVKRAIELIESHPELPLTVNDLAREACVSVRSLQEGFRRHVGLPPMEYLREVRMRRAHEELLAADPRSGVTVTEVAARWGFAHFGRFSLAYRKRFGELPSATLRR